MRGPCFGPTVIEPIDSPPGPQAVADSLFLPAKARQAFATTFSGASLRIEVELPERNTRQPRLVAVDAADRPRRRKTW
ncbi:MAG: putative lipoprotein YbaY [Myxococcota bacterium]